MLSPAEIIRREKKFSINDGSDNPDRSQFILVRIGQAVKEHAIHQAEHRRRRANPERQRDHGNRRKAWAPLQLPK